jgi:hypothetical protein
MIGSPASVCVCVWIPSGIFNSFVSFHRGGAAIDRRENRNRWRVCRLQTDITLPARRPRRRLGLNIYNVRPSTTKCVCAAAFLFVTGWPPPSFFSSSPVRTPSAVVPASYRIRWNSHMLLARDLCPTWVIFQRVFIFFLFWQQTAAEGNVQHRNNQMWEIEMKCFQYWFNSSNTTLTQQHITVESTRATWIAIAAILFLFSVYFPVSVYNLHETRLLASIKFFKIPALDGFR